MYVYVHVQKARLSDDPRGGFLSRLQSSGYGPQSHTDANSRGN